MRGGVVEKLFGRIPFEQHFSLAGASLREQAGKINVLKIASIYVAFDSLRQIKRKPLFEIGRCAPFPL